MDKYLLEILKNVNTIIIPGLGALTITNHETGEIMFMPYLKHDDGKLASYIAENEGMEEVDAKNLIAKYVREISAKLDQGDTYDMYQFGSFKKVEAGEIVFENWVDGSSNSDNETLPEPKTIAIEDKTEPIVEEAKELVKNDEKEAANVEEIIAKEENITFPREIPPIVAKVAVIPEEIKPIKPIKPEVVQTETAAPVTTKEMNVAEKEEVDKNRQKLDRLREAKTQKPVKKRKGAGFYILTILILALIAGGIYFGANYNKLKQHIPFLADVEAPEAEENALETLTEIIEAPVDSPNENESEIKEESVPTQSDDESSEIIADEPKIESDNQALVSNSTGTNPYHIIAGAFLSADNAERLSKTLRDKGFPSRTITRWDKTLVILQSYPSQQQADEGLASSRDAVPKGWILYKE